MDKEKAEIIKQEFKKRRRQQFLAIVPIVGVFLYGMLASSTQSPLLGYVMIGIILFILLFSFYNWRCPGCQRYLGRGINPKFCPHCGAELT